MGAGSVKALMSLVPLVDTVAGSPRPSGSSSAMEEAGR
jgi:hypothetical protein